MSRKIVPLTPELLEALESPCRSCLFWERDPVTRGRLGEDERVALKGEWLTRVLGEWGPCGQVALVDDRPVGYLVHVPEAFVPGAGAFPTSPASTDAVLLTTAYVATEHARGGLGRMMVQRMARDLLRRDVRAVEAYGDTRVDGLGRVPAASCRLPVDFLVGVGFHVQRAHSTTPRLRMELRAAVPWKSVMESGEAALERLVGAVRPSPRPTRAQRGTGPAGSSTQLM